MEYLLMMYLPRLCLPETRCEILKRNPLPEDQVMWMGEEKSIDLYYLETKIGINWLC